MGTDHIGLRFLDDDKGALNSGDAEPNRDRTVGWLLNITQVRQFKDVRFRKVGYQVGMAANGALADGRLLLPKAERPL